MAKDKEKIEDKGNLSDVFVVTVKGFHGKMLRPGERLSRGKLITLGGFVPEYCVPVGTPEAIAAIEDSNISEDGFKNNDERVKFLAAKGVHVSEKLGKAKLQELIAQTAMKKPPQPEINPLA